MAQRLLYVDAIGAFTSVGLNAAQTMGSLRTGVDMFRSVASLPPTPVASAPDAWLDPSGQPLVIAPTPAFSKVADARERLAVMAALALRECADSMLAKVRGALTPVPLILCCAEPEQSSSRWPARHAARDATENQALLEDIVARAGAPVHLGSSKVVACGRSSLVTALTHARALMAARQTDCCFVGGVDTLLTWERLDRWLARGRVHWGQQSPQGVIPGEGAAFLAVTDCRSPRAMAVILGLGAQHDDNTSLGAPGPHAVTANALTAAARQALAEAQVSLGNVSLLSHDVAGGRAFLREVSLCTMRLRPASTQRLDTFAPATSVGEIGAAAGPLALAYAAFGWQQGVLPPASTCLHLSLPESAAPREAVVLTDVTRR